MTLKKKGFLQMTSVSIVLLLQKGLGQDKEGHSFTYSFSRVDK